MLFQLCMWNKALTESEVYDRALMEDLSSVSSDLLAHYTMDTRPGGVLYDQMDNLPGKLYGGVRKVEVSDAIAIFRTALVSGFHFNTLPVLELSC